jgi:hypothetical protein
VDQRIKKYVIGLGCSWTQGEGGYPEYIWKEYNGRVQIRAKPDEHVRIYEHENSWVNVLCRDHMPDHTPINLGARGIGNRAAVKQLYFCDTVDWDNSEGYIILMLSGLERFDFFSQHPYGPNNNNHKDGYSNGDFRHYKWRTMWPHPNDGPEGPLWTIYFEMLHSDEFIACETMIALLELQAFCKAYNFKIIVANAFNNYHPKGLDEFLRIQTKSLFDKFNWNTYLHKTTPYTAFVQKFVELDGLMNPKDWGGHYEFYEKMAWPPKYLTNCIHPNVDGYKVIAEELHKFIKSNAD